MSRVHVGGFNKPGKAKSKLGKFRNLSRVEGTKKVDLREGVWIWYEDDDLICVPAEVVQVEKGEVSIKLYDDEQEGAMYREDDLVQLTEEDMREWTEADASHLDGVENMIHLGDFHLGAILHNLRARFRQSHIYSNIGNILVAMNPYERLPLYGKPVMSKYIEQDNEALPPHVYQIAKSAYAQMLEGRGNQSIIISGESGAGKTETMKLVLQFLAEHASQGSLSTVEDRILQSNPILESFGNACTLRNNNSSRFGKWTEVFFDRSGRINGARITNYLLEKVRVVRPTQGERNYHIFYYLCAGLAAHPEMNEELKLADARAYRYLYGNDSLLTVEGIDDKAEFETVLNALTAFNMTEEERSDLFRVLAGVLHLGNVDFEETGGDGSQAVDTNGALGLACGLLGFEAAQFQEAMCWRVIGKGTSAETRKPRTTQEASDARDAAAKALYERLFDWIVHRLNQSIAHDKSTSSSLIGVLDIYGFEQFEINSFEQLCINYANEKLQQHFNKYIFKEEQKAAEQEKIDFKAVQFEDNQHTIDLFEEGDGIFQMLDQSLLTNGTDDNFLSNLQSVHSSDKYDAFFTPLRRPKSFGVKHYAGEVEYTAAGFLEKNRDTLDAGVMQLLLAGRPFVQSLFETSEYKSLSKQGTKLATGSLGRRYQVQLRDLMTSIEATTPHFVRCIKPNSLKKPRLVEPLLTTQQLKYAGFLEAIRIRRLGYPVRTLFKAFVARYRIIAHRAVFPSQTVKQQLTSLLEQLKIKGLDVGPPHGVQVGLKRVFLKTEHVQKLDAMREKAMLDSVCRLQNVSRRRMASAGFPARLALFRKLNEALGGGDKRDLDALKELVAAASDLELDNAVVSTARGLLDKGQKLLSRMAAAKAAMDLAGLRTTLADASAMRVGSAAITEAVTVLEKVESIRKLVVQALDTKDMDMLDDCLVLCSDIGYTDAQVKEATELRDRLREEMPLEATLQRACKSKNVADLERGLEQATRLGFQSQAVDDAKLLLAQLKHREQVKSDLTRGLAAQSLDILEAAVKAAQAIQLSDKLVDQAEAAIVPLRAQHEAVERLKDAMAAVDLPKLDDSIKAAEELGLKCDELVDATKMRDGIIKESGVTSRLTAAIEARSLDTLEEAVELARQMNFKAAVVTEAETLLERVREEEILKTMLDVAIQQKSKDMLSQALDKADHLHVDWDAARQARALLEKLERLNEAITVCVRERTRSTISEALSQARVLQVEGRPEVKDVMALEAAVERESVAKNQLKLAVSKNDLDLINEAMKGCRAVHVAENAEEMLLATEACAKIVEGTNANVERLESTLQDRDAEVATLKDQLAKLQADIKQLQEENRTERERYMSELEGVNLDRYNVVKETMEQKDAIKDLQLQLKTTEQASADEKAKFEGELRHADEAFSVLKKQYDKKQSECDQLTVSLHLAQDQATSKEKEVEKLSEKIEQKEEEEHIAKETGPRIQGWLDKAGGALGRHKRRYFIAKAGCLFYYAGNDSVDTPLGVVPLMQVFIRSMGKSSAGYGLEIYSSVEGARVQSSKRKGSSMVPGHHETFQLYAENPIEHDQWLKTMKLFIHELNPDQPMEDPSLAPQEGSKGDLSLPVPTGDSRKGSTGRKVRASVRGVFKS